MKYFTILSFVILMFMSCDNSTDMGVSENKVTNDLQKDHSNKFIKKLKNYSPNPDFKTIIDNNKEMLSYSSLDDLFDFSDIILKTPSFLKLIDAFEDKELVIDYNSAFNISTGNEKKLTLIPYLNKINNKYEGNFLWDRMTNRIVANSLNKNLADIKNKNYDFNEIIFTNSIFIHYMFQNVFSYVDDKVLLDFLIDYTPREKTNNFRGCGWQSFQLTTSSGTVIQYQYEWVCDKLHCYICDRDFNDVGDPDLPGSLGCGCGTTVSSSGNTVCLPCGNRDSTNPPCRGSDITNDWECESMENCIFTTECKCLPCN